ncbi:MAG: sulfur oxidation c-type cytochrome SoxX [Proteobacteria bacterium]|nr:sulfur oxidation c-type cytochrome SoxX [Pseudomonadota bacterium]MDA0861419.1 sulfur oxidation c-type cytochrome SoxX [Pseudomonadota bacterium]MDA1030974.1 sulfur oxidation c-type cytochrome SoxX [Pseudomonadota bacterium]
MATQLPQPHASIRLLTIISLGISALFYINHVRAENESILTGRELAHSYDHGNCLACHAAPTDKHAVTLANIAPPFIDMKRRFPSKEDLFKQIWDARDTYPKTIMPPFGAYNILSEAEIRKIIEYLYTL